MSKGSLTWLRQHTNVEDLLDDGVENNSDLKCFAKGDELSCDETDQDTSQTALRSVSGTITSVAPTDKSPSASVLGIALGLLTTLSGLVLVIFPVNMLVYHQRSRSFFGTWEFVTPGRSEFYGVSGLIIGLGIVLFATYRPRR
jgi:hypothetical protein